MPQHPLACQPQAWAVPHVPDVEDLLQKAVDFLAALHSQSAQGYGDSDRSLRDHYRRRLSLTGTILQSRPLLDILGPSAIEMMQRIFWYVSERLEKAVLPEEILAPIHGDYRENNLLIDAQSRQCWIVDFDQGLTPGDWASDLWKFGLLQYEAGRMNGMLSQGLFARLGKRYLSHSTRDATRSFLSGGEDAIRLWVELLLFDISFSMLLFRYNLGWDFISGTVEGRTVRGTGFILQLFQKQHDRVVKH